MLTLINTNVMRPPIAPIGLDYIAAATRAAGIETDVVDPCLAADPAAALQDYFATHSPRLVGLSFRNLDDSFWPSMTSFLPVLARTAAQVRCLTDAPIVLGGTGFSIFPGRILRHVAADFGVHGDGEAALVALARALQNRGSLGDVPGLVWRGDDGQVHRNAPAWGEPPAVLTARDAVDNPTYLRLGGQIGLETKRGCDRQCIFCADVLAKGADVRPRPPAQVADEVESLLAQGVDVLHLCDAEFNIPYAHAMAVCEELIRRGLGERLRWYAYLAVVPFDEPLAAAMRRAGCVGINFTGPAAGDAMLAAYRQPHRQADLAATVRAAKAHGITVMLDLMLGGPGETPATLADAIAFAKSLPVDCVGASLGVRLYPHLPMLDLVRASALSPPPPLQSPCHQATLSPCHLPAARPAQPDSRPSPLSPVFLDDYPGIRRRYPGPVDLLQPTYYVSPALGDRPAALVRDLIAGDRRFFEPADEADATSRDHNYNDNAPLVAAIAAGARGAYWDILRQMRGVGGG